MVINFSIYIYANQYLIKIIERLDFFFILHINALKMVLAGA